MTRSCWSWLRWKCASCSRVQVPGEKTPIVIGSALKALEGDKSEIGVAAVIKLVEEMDNFIPVPKRDIEKPFLMPVEMCSRSPARHGGDRAASSAGSSR